MYTNLELFRSRHLPRRIYAALVLAWMTALAQAGASAYAQESGPAAPVSQISILVGFGPAQGNDQPARPDAATLASNRMTPDMSYDQTARFLARRLGHFLPGAPAIVARHVPGGAGLAAARLLAGAPPDGGTIALLSSNIIYSSALGLPGAMRETLQLTWLGGVAADAWACLRTEASTGRTPVWTGSLGMGSRADVHARAMREIANYPFEIASGYVSRFELIRALENGEIDAACGWPMRDLERRRPEWLAGGKMRILALFSRTMAGPTAPEWTPSGPVAEAFDALAAESELAWPLAAPPNMAPSAAAAYGAALEALSFDRAAIEEAQRAGITLDPVAAATVRAKVNRLHAMSPEARALLARLYGRE